MTDEYELWSWRTRDELSRVLWPNEQGWQFHGYHRLTLYHVLQFEAYGYVVRKVVGDRSSTIPLFPLLGSSGEYPDQGMD